MVLMKVVARVGMFLGLCALPMCSMLRAQAGASDQTPQFAMGSGRMVRGTITAVSPDRLTVKTEQGDSYTVALTANTQLRHGRDSLKAAEVHVGDAAGAMGEVDQASKTVHALFVAVVSADDLKKAREAMGKTFISGSVTAMDETKLTILRTDKVTQVIQVDEDTSFRRGGRALQMALGEGGGPGSGLGSGRAGRPEAPATANADSAESITLADIKVGDLVAGPGKLKNGIFTPTQLSVSDPTRQRRRGNGGNPRGDTAPPVQPPPELEPRGKSCE